MNEIEPRFTTYSLIKRIIEVERVIFEIRKRTIQWEEKRREEEKEQLRGILCLLHRTEVV